MGILRKEGNPYEIYENQALGVLVAIERDDCKLIKAYFKKYKGKKDAPKEKISGYAFINDEEHDSLKIDFSNRKEFFIGDLNKFKG